MAEHVTHLIADLRAVGFAVDEAPVVYDNYEFAVIRGYQIVSGTMAGQVVDVAIWAPAGYPINAPGGIHVAPPLSPPNPVHLFLDIVHNNALVAATAKQWQYWSRPFRPDTWQHDKAGKCLKTHIATIFSDA
jgi:hypothetical protein